jgi:hypothetical protein
MAMAREEFERKKGKGGGSEGRRKTGCNVENLNEIRKTIQTSGVKKRLGLQRGL